MSNRFYVDHPLDLGPVILHGPQAHHLAAVNRARQGDQVCLFNGNGYEYPATVMELSRKAVTLAVTAVAAPERELAFVLEVAAPLPKGDRGRFLVEKLTELGITRYVPLRTERSVSHPGANRTEKLGQYVIEASKQCGRNVLMSIEPMADWPSYCKRGHPPDSRIVAHPLENTDGERTSLRSLLTGRPPGFAIAVGPEGGFTPAEISVARDAGWRVISLGPRILRVETAALVIAACAAMTPSGAWEVL